MGMTFEKPEGISWNPASVELPPVPMIPPGQDAMSMTISAVLPTLATPLAASVTTLAAKEAMFSGKVVEAQGAYQNADDSGGQSVGQLSSMIGQVGQMAQQAGGAGGGAGGGMGMFGQLMQQAMQAAQGAGGQPGAGMAPTGGQPMTGATSAAQPGVGTNQDPRQETRPAQDSPTARDEGEQQVDEQEQRAPANAAGGPGGNGEGLAPAAPPERRELGGGDELARRA